MDREVAISRVPGTNFAGSSGSGPLTGSDKLTMDTKWILTMPMPGFKTWTELGS